MEQKLKMSTIKPSPLMVIIFGVLMIVCIVISIAEFADTYGSSAATICADVLVAVALVINLVKYSSQDKIEYDESSFTVADKSYSLDEITNVTVDSEQILRSWSTLRLRIYIGEDEVCSFTKDDKGAKEFIEVMKKHGVSVSIDT